MEYDLLQFYKSNIIALSGTKGAHVDLSALPEKLGSNFEERLMRYMAYRKSGLSLFDSSQEGNMPNTFFGGFDDTITVNNIQAIQLALQMVEETASSITGVFKERLGGIQQRDAVQNVEVGMQQSFIITKQYYQAMDTMVSEILTDCLNMARRVYKKGLSGQLVLGNKKEIFTILPEHYSQTDYDVHVLDSAEIIKELDLLRQWAMQLSQTNQADVEDVAIILSSKSITEARETLRKSIQQKKEENNQLMQLQQALEQAQQQQKQLQQQLQQATSQIDKFAQQKLQVEFEMSKNKNDIDMYKAETDRMYKTKELQLISDRNKLEELQLYDNNAKNDEVLDRKR